MTYYDDGSFSVELSKGANVSEVLKAHFNKAEIYFIKNGNFSKKVPVIM